MRAFLLILLFFISLEAFSQNEEQTVPLTLLVPLGEEENKSVQKEKAPEMANSIGVATFSPFGAATLSNFTSNVSVSSFLEEGVNGKIQLQGKFGGRTVAGISVDQKIGKKDKEAAPLSLTGISPGTTVEFNLQKMFWNPSFEKTNDKAKVAKLKELMKEYASDSIDWRNVSLKDLYTKGNKEQRAAALEMYETREGARPLLINVRPGFTKTSYKYATDSITLKASKESFITPTVTASLIQILGSEFRITGYISLAYNYSESYETADDLTFNIPFGNTGNFYSNTIAFGKPTKKTNHTVIAEYRRNLFRTNDDENIKNIAISPSGTYSFTNNKLSLFLPIYLIRGADKDGKLIEGLQGGIRLGYITGVESNISSFKEGFTAQIIITQPLNFLDNL